MAAGSRHCRRPGRRRPRSGTRRSGRGDGCRNAPVIGNAVAVAVDDLRALWVILPRMASPGSAAGQKLCSPTCPAASPRQKRTPSAAQARGRPAQAPDRSRPTPSQCRTGRRRRAALRRSAGRLGCRSSRPAPDAAAGVGRRSQRRDPDRAAEHEREARVPCPCDVQETLDPHRIEHARQRQADAEQQARQQCHGGFQGAPGRTWRTRKTVAIANAMNVATAAIDRGDRRASPETP